MSFLINCCYKPIIVKNIVPKSIPTLNAEKFLKI